MDSTHPWPYQLRAYVISRWSNHSAHSQYLSLLITMQNRLLSLSLLILFLGRRAFAAIIQPRQVTADKVTLAELEQSVCKDVERSQYRWLWSNIKPPRRQRLCCDPLLEGDTEGMDIFLSCILCKEFPQPGLLSFLSVLGSRFPSSLAAEFLVHHLVQIKLIKTVKRFDRRKRSSLLQRPRRVQVLCESSTISNR